MAGTRALTLDMLAPNVDHLDASDVIRLAKAGDETAFGRLVVEHETFVLRTAWRLVGNTEDARDIAQEAFLRLYRHLGAVRPDRDLRAWLYRVTVNLGLTVLRRRRRKPEAQLEAGLAAAEGPGDRLDQERRSDAADARRVLAVVLDGLSDKERAAVVLRDLEGLDVGEVAAALGCRRGTVRAHLSRGRLKLREALASREGSP